MTAQVVTHLSGQVHQPSPSKGKVRAMVTGTAFPWEDNSAPEGRSRAAWRAAVAAIAAKAHEKLPECNGRVDSAVKLVLTGDVELLADGTARVASQSDGTTTYHIVNGHCDCALRNQHKNK